VRAGTSITPTARRAGADRRRRLPRLSPRPLDANPQALVESLEDDPLQPFGDGAPSISANGDVRVRSAAGWDITALVPELAAIDRRVELVALDVGGRPSQPRLPATVAGDRSVPIVFVSFDVLAVDGRAVDHEPYRGRRRRLEARSRLEARPRH
jgi:hypothetical protein